MNAIMTGSGGPIGSACVRMPAERGWEMAGVDNDMRSRFFGSQGTTHPVVENVIQFCGGYRPASIPYEDFDTSAVGTMKLSVAACKAAHA